MKIITSQDIARYSKQELFKKAFIYLEQDLKNWQDFKKSPRHAVHFSHGVFEQMPVADNEFYTSKYVNAHPANPEKNKLSIIATGMLADTETGYPQLFCDMTILTAIRTAATSAIAAQHLAVKESTVLGLIGTGAQSEFQTFAMLQLFPIRQIKYFDQDKKAMKKYHENMVDMGIELIPCENAEKAVENIDILTTCICEKSHAKLFPYEKIKGNDHLFINAIGGDCPGKTELDPEILRHSKIVVEFFNQTKVEGEIQNLSPGFDYSELWEIVQCHKKGRTKNDNCIVFDSVGFAVADFSMMRMLNDLPVGRQMEIVPALDNPKNLYGLIN